MFDMDRPTDIISPRDTIEVSRCVRSAIKTGLRITPVGGRTLRRLRAAQTRDNDGEPNPAQDDGDRLILDTSQLKGIYELDKGNLTVSVGAGTTLARLCCRVTEEGLYLPLIPYSWDKATVGGTIAANSGSRYDGLYGRAAAFLRGMEVVTADGSVALLGGKTVKNVTGYNLTRLYAGSLGSLGVITKVILRLRPLPEEAIGFIIPFGQYAEAAAVATMLRRESTPACAETLPVLPPELLSGSQRLSEALAVPGPSPRAILAVKYEGLSPEVDSWSRWMRRRLSSLSILDKTLMMDAKETEALFQAYGRLLSSVIDDASRHQCQPGPVVSDRSALHAVIARLNSGSGTRNHQLHSSVADELDPTRVFLPDGSSIFTACSP